MNLDIRCGRWQDVLRDVEADALIFDAPYSQRTHASAADRSDGSDAGGLAPTYSYLTRDDVRAFVESWAPRCRGWMVSITDDILAPTWKAAMEDEGRCTFQSVPCVITGMSVRMQGDGPSSWAVHAIVSRPREKRFIGGWTTPGAYVGTAQPGASGGRGKPMWLMNALVRDYSRPGDLVVDPFAGWGTTLLAALAQGRRAIGAEVDGEAIAVAQRRAARGIQVDLFAGNAG